MAVNPFLSFNKTPYLSASEIIFDLGRIKLLSSILTGLFLPLLDVVVLMHNILLLFKRKTSFEQIVFLPSLAFGFLFFLFFNNH